MATFAEVFDNLRPIFAAKALERIRNEIPLYIQMPVEAVEQRVRDLFDAFRQDLVENTYTRYSDYMHKISLDRFRQDVPLMVPQQALRIANDEVIAALRENLPKGNDLRLDAVDRCHRITESGMLGMYAGYEEAQAQIIDSQQSALQELSTPIIPIYEGVLVLPIVGAIDSRRAGQIMEGLLEGISANSADVVIMDITGVPMIDTGVANYLLQAARAARLLGSTVVLVGIGAEIAQTIVQLGIDLAGIATRANLQAGIEYALAMQGLGIQPLEGGGRLAA